MKPVTQALNILQSETNTHMGWLLPVIFQLEEKLDRLQESCKVCLPLIIALQVGVQKRFGGTMEDAELIAAAILLPKFKTTWTEKTDIIEAGMTMLIMIIIIIIIEGIIWDIDGGCIKYKQYSQCITYCRSPHRQFGGVSTSSTQSSVLLCTGPTAKHFSHLSESLVQYHVTK